MLGSFVDPRAKCVKFILFANLLVFCVWQLTFKPPVHKFMLSNFLISPLHLQEGLWLNLITAAFSHNALWHFLLNMFVLISFGPIIEILVGRKKFLLFYFCAAIVSSLSHCMVSYYMLKAPDSMALGASGAISGLVLLFSLMYPKEKLYIFGLIPMPAIIAALAFVGIDIWGLTLQTQGSGHLIGHGAHLGGALCGVVFFTMLKLRK